MKMSCWSSLCLGVLVSCVSSVNGGEVRTAGLFNNMLGVPVPQQWQGARPTTAGQISNPAYRGQAPGYGYGNTGIVPPGRVAGRNCPNGQCPSPTGGVPAGGFSSQYRQQPTGDYNTRGSQSVNRPLNDWSIANRATNQWENSGYRRDDLRDSVRLNSPQNMRPVSSQSCPGGFCGTCPSGQCDNCPNGQCANCPNGQCVDCVDGQCRLHNAQAPRTNSFNTRNQWEPRNYAPDYSLNRPARY